MDADSDIAIWHYLDLAKYVGLLSRGLFFALPSALRFSDPWEGCWGEVDFKELLDSTVHSLPDGVKKWEESLKAQQIIQDQFGISCWHNSSTESAALWRLYAPLGFGVVIKSTPRRVQAALGRRNIITRSIDYSGHHKCRLGDDPLVLLSTKRPEFKHEAELRFIAPLTSDEQTVLTSIYEDTDRGKFRYIRPGLQKGVLVIPSSGITNQDPTCINRGAPAGMHLHTDITELIEQIYLAPDCSYALRRAVIDVTKQFGFDEKLVTEAEFNLAPFNRVRIV